MSKRIFGTLLATGLCCLVFTAGGNAQVPLMQFTFESGTANDDSGNGNNGELLGTAAIVDDAEHGKVLEVNGSGMQVVNLVDITTEFTLSAWTKLEIPRVGRYYFGGPWQIRTDNQGATEHHWCEIRYPGGSFVDKFDTRTGSNPDGQLDGEWHHIAVVLPEDGSVKAYVDGVLAPARDGDTKAYDYGGGVGPLFFGSENATGGNAIQGYMDDIRVYNEAIPEEDIPSLIGPIVQRNTLDLELSPPDATVTWIAQPIYKYTLQNTTNSTLASNTWTDVSTFTNVPGTDGGMTATTAMAGSPLEAFRLSMDVPPPVFFDDLEDGVGGWTTNTVAGSTDWELGTPNYIGIRVTPTPSTNVFTNAYSGVNAWSTGLTNGYVQGDNTKLRTPVIDLTGMGVAVLAFNELKDTEATFDFGWVNILDTNNAVLGAQVYAATGTSDTWTQKTVSLNAFTNQKIIIEFELWEDGLQFDPYYGWVIDDIWVSVVAPPPLPPPPVPPFTNSVTELILTTSGSNSVDLASITNNGTYDLDALGAVYSNVNVRAEVDGAVGSVKFALTGATAHNQTESVAPYYLYGDTGVGAFIQNGTLSNGLHNLAATVWEAAGGGGQEGTNLTVNFTILTTY